MKKRLLTFIACVLSFSSIGFASSPTTKTPQKKVLDMKFEEPGWVARRAGYNKYNTLDHPETHIDWVRNETIRILTLELVALQSEITQLNSSISAIKLERAKRKAAAPIQTISFAELKQIFNEAKAAR
jgi:hypothetical protein